MKNILFTLTHPSYWIMLKRYSKHLDNWINEQLESNPEFKDRRECWVTMNGKRFWVANRPYGFELEDTDLRPSRVTVDKFYDALDKADIYGNTLS